VNTEAPLLIWLAMSLWTFWAGGASWPVVTYLASEKYLVEIFDERVVGERG